MRWLSGLNEVRYIEHLECLARSEDSPGWYCCDEFIVVQKYRQIFSFLEKGTLRCSLAAGL